MGHQPTRKRDRKVFASPVSGTDLFGRAGFFLAFRSQIIPWLKTFPEAKIWIIGCPPPAKLFLLGILFSEELLDRVSVYVTDSTARKFTAARDGILSLAQFRSLSVLYKKSGGPRDLGFYFKKDGDKFRVIDSISSPFSFFEFEATEGSSFNQFQMIIDTLKKSTWDAEKDNLAKLIESSLQRFGILASLESEAIHQFPNHYRDWFPENGFYKRIG